jgi:hypothetical protein
MLTMEGWLEHLPLVAPCVPFACKETFPEDAANVARRAGLYEGARFAHQRLFDQIRVVEKKHAPMKKAEPNEISIIARAAFQEAERVMLELREISQEPAAAGNSFYDDLAHPMRLCEVRSGCNGYRRSRTLDKSATPVSPRTLQVTSAEIAAKMPIIENQCDQHENGALLRA